MKGFLNAVFQEVRLDLKASLQYRTGLLTDAAIFVGSFLAAFFLGSGSSLTSFYRADTTQGIMLLLIGYLFWGNSSAALGYCTGTLQGEMERGIFEMRLQSRYPLTLLLFCRPAPSCIFWYTEFCLQRQPCSQALPRRMAASCFSPSSSSFCHVWPACTAWD